MVVGRAQIRIQLQRAKQEKRIRENIDIAAVIICWFAMVYIGGHLVWWAVR